MCALGQRLVSRVSAPDCHIHNFTQLRLGVRVAAMINQVDQQCQWRYGIFIKVVVSCDFVPHCCRFKQRSNLAPTEPVFTYDLAAIDVTGHESMPSKRKLVDLLDLDMHTSVFTVHKQSNYLSRRCNQAHDVGQSVRKMIIQLFCCSWSQQIAVSQTIKQIILCRFNTHGFFVPRPSIKCVAPVFNPRFLNLSVNQ